MVKLLLRTPVAHAGSCFKSQQLLPLISIPAGVSWHAAVDGSSGWAPATHMGLPDEGPGFKLAQPSNCVQLGCEPGWQNWNAINFGVLVVLLTVLQI